MDLLSVSDHAEVSSAPAANANEKARTHKHTRTHARMHARTNTNTHTHTHRGPAFVFKLIKLIKISVFFKSPQHNQCFVFWSP